MSCKISIIIPALNESGTIEKTLMDLQHFRSTGHEIIVSDGLSCDNTAEIAEPLADKVICSPRGRSKQMNAGAQVAAGEILWFLHADTIPPKNADEYIFQEIMVHKKIWGQFNVRLSGNSFLFRIIEVFMNLRSWISGIATGDQGIFVRSDIFRNIGGYPDISLMEDIALSKALRKIEKFSRPSLFLVTSSRRWEQKGILRTVFLMWYLRFAYAYGISPQKLSEFYK